MRKLSSFPGGFIFFFLIDLLIFVPGISQNNEDIRRAIFSKTEEVLQTARESNVPLLSPQHFARASQFYEQTVTDFANGESLKNIQSGLHRCNEELERATQSARLAGVALEDLIKVRIEALQLRFSGIPEAEEGQNTFTGRLLSIKDFQGEQSYNLPQAEAKFSQAVSRVEADDIGQARLIAEQAEHSYRAASLNILKNEVLAAAKLELANNKANTSPEKFRTAQVELKKIADFLEEQRNTPFSILELFSEIVNRGNRVMDMAGVGQLDEALPDLVVEELIIHPQGLQKGETGRIAVLIGNGGPAPAEGIEVEFLSDQGEVIGRTAIERLAAGQKHETQISYAFPNAGDWRIIIRLDPDDLIDESNNQNNKASKSISIKSLVGKHSKKLSLFSNKEVFLISDQYWRDVLQLVSVTTWRDPNSSGKMYKYPVMIYHREGNNFDADAIIRFLQQYQPSHLTIFDSILQNLDNLLIAAQPVGAGISANLINRKKMKDYLSYWAAIEWVVISEDDYQTALMASVLASYINAPLMFEGHFDYHQLDGRIAYVVGKISPALKKEIQKRCKTGHEKTKFTLEELRSNYIKWTGANKIILANHDDLKIKIDRKFTPEKSGAINSIHSRHSLAAPFLAAAKQEVIISTASRYYFEIDSYVEDMLQKFKLSGKTIFLTIVANPMAIPMARENRSGTPALWGNQMVFTEIDPEQVTTFAMGLSMVTNNFNPGTATTPGGGSSIAVGDITSDAAKPRFPDMYGSTIVWQDDRNGKPDIYMLDYQNKEQRITNDKQAQQNPALYKDKIVWEDNRNGNWDIYMYNLQKNPFPSNMEFQITVNSKDQKNPAIYNDKIVWQDKRNSYKDSKGKTIYQWDIYLGDLNQKKEIRVTSDKHTQLNPAIEGNRIVWQDNRNGNWDVYLYDISSAKETRITTNSSAQLYPGISGNFIVWEDNRNGNYDVYLYDLIKKTETRLTTSDNHQIHPLIRGNKIIWYSDGPSGLPGYPVTPCTKNCGGRWLLYMYDIPSKMSSGRGVTLSPEEATFRQELDGRFYGSSVNFGKQDRAVGRIFGVTTSDVSAYIARDLFYDAIPKSRHALLVVREDHQKETYNAPPGVNGVIDGPTLEKYARDTYWTNTVRNQFTVEHFFFGADIGTHPVNPSINFIRSIYDDADMILYSDHGGGNGFSDGPHPVMTTNDLTNVSLAPSTILNIACATNTVLWGYVPPDDIFAVENIRRGAMVFMGAVDLSYWHRMFDNILDRVYVDGKTIGEAYMEARNEEYSDNLGNFCRERKGDTYYGLLGDPTFKPKWW